MSARNALKEIEETTDDGKQMETKITKTEDTTIKNVLMELKSVIDKHLNNTEQVTKNKKGKPIIKNIENVKLNIPFLENRRRDVTWADVVAKRRSPGKQNVQRGRQESDEGTTDDPETTETYRTKNKTARMQKQQQMRTREPEEIIERKTKKTAAITITTRGDITNKDIMIRAKREITLKDLGIENCQVRSGFTGGLVIEIPGDDAETKADNLAIKLREIFINEQVRVNRPRVKADMKITGLDETMTNEDIQLVLSNNGECSFTDIRINARRITTRGNGIA